MTLSILKLVLHCRFKTFSSFDILKTLCLMNSHDDDNEWFLDKWNIKYCEILPFFDISNAQVWQLFISNECIFVRNSETEYFLVYAKDVAVSSCRKPFELLLQFKIVKVKMDCLTLQFLVLLSSLGPGLGPWSWSNSKFMVKKRPELMLWSKCTTHSTTK